MRQIKKLLTFVAIIAFVIVTCIMLFSGGIIEHIEDTNGADTHTLQTITDANIEKLDIGSKGFTKTRNNITKKTTYSSNKFTGVTEVYGTNVISGDYTININIFEVDGGNVKLVLVKDDKIVHEFNPNEISQMYTVEDASGSYISLRIAGESADFKLEIL